MPAPIRHIVAIFILTLLLCTAHAGAWGNKEHIQLTRLAAMRLVNDPETPEAMKAWLRQITPDLRDMEFEREYFMTARVGQITRGVNHLTYWATMPDMLALVDREKLQPYGVPERLLHYIDLEFFPSDESKRRYAHDLSGKPKLEEIPRDVKDPRYQRAGMLPFRVEECHQQLVRTLKAGKLTDKPGQYPRDDHAARWAGFLAHYLQDNTQPHHSTMEYKSASYFAHKQSAPNVHAEMEYRMNDDEAEDYMALREEFWPIFVKELETVEDPATSADAWQGVLEVSLRSYDALPLIGLAAMAAAQQAGTPDHPTGPTKPFDTEVFFRHKGSFLGREMSVTEMKAHQQALAVLRVAKAWRAAWKEAMGE